jgi:hypothetical protein
VGVAAIRIFDAIPQFGDFRNIIKQRKSQGWKKYFIFWDRNEKWENFLQVVDANPV